MEDLIGTMEDLAVDVSVIEDLTMSPFFINNPRQHRRSICLDSMPIKQETPTSHLLTPRMNFQPSTPTSNLDLFSSPLLSSRTSFNSTKPEPFLKPMINQALPLSMFHTRPEPIIAQPVFIGPPTNTTFAITTTTSATPTIIVSQIPNPNSAAIVTPSTPIAPPSTPAESIFSSNEKAQCATTSTSNKTRSLRPRRSSKPSRDEDFISSIKVESEEMMETDDDDEKPVVHAPKNEGEEEWEINTRYQTKHNKTGPKQTAIKKKKRMSVQDDHHINTFSNNTTTTNTNSNAFNLSEDFTSSSESIHKRTRNVTSPNHLNNININNNVIFSSPLDTDEDKQKRRLLANRLAAQASRDRKKAKKRQLEGELEHLSNERQRTLNKLKNLREETDSLKGEFQSLLCAMICHTATQQQSQIGSLLTAVGGRFLQNQIQQQSKPLNKQIQQNSTPTPMCEV